MTEFKFKVFKGPVCRIYFHLVVNTMILILRGLYTKENILINIIFNSCRETLLNLAHWTFKFLVLPDE